MSIKRRKYDKEFKLEAIRVFENGERSMSDVERELGITSGMMGRWLSNLSKQAKKQEAFPGNGHLPETEARIRQLERENAQLRQDKDILKKVLSMYSKEEK
jgi:transposase